MQNKNNGVRQFSRLRSGAPQLFFYHGLRNPKTQIATPASYVESPAFRQLYLIRIRSFAMAWILIVAVFFSPLVFAQAPLSSDGDEKRIIVLENIWNQTQMSHDANAMASMLHSDFVFTDYDGTLMSKPVFLASIRDPSNKLSVEESNEMKLHRYGDTVVVTGSTHEKGTQKGKAYEHYGRFTDTWIKSDGQWVCVASQLGLVR